MSRRQFLKNVAALLGAGATAPAGATGMVIAPLRLIELQRSPLAGFPYYQGELVWAQLAVGTALQLVRETDNAHDARAVRVEWQGQKLGYVPRIDNAAISQLLDRRQTLKAAITALEVSDDPWARVEFAVYLEN